MSAERYSVEQVAEALRQSAGIYTAAAVMLQCAPNTVRNYVERYPELQDVLDDVLRVNLDLAEIGLINQIKNAEAKDHYKSLAFYLANKGQDRGYGNRGGRPKKPETVAAEGLDLRSEEGVRVFYERLAAQALASGDVTAAIRAVEQLQRYQPPRSEAPMPALHTPEGVEALFAELEAVPLELLERCVAQRRARAGGGTG